MYEFLLLSALSATTFTLGKKVLLCTIPSFLIAVRLTVAGILFLSYYLIQYRFRLPTLKSLPWWLFLKIAVAAFGAGYLLEFWALQYMVSGKAALLFSFGPILAASISYFSFKEVMTFKKACGLLLSLVGFIPELLMSGGKEGPEVLFISWPELALFMAVGCFAYGWTLMRKALKDYHVPISLLNGVCMILGGLFSFAFSFFDPQRSSFNSLGAASFFPVSDWSCFLGYTVALIIIGNIMCYALYGYLLRRYTATMLTFGELLTPLFAAFYGWIFLNEYVGWPFFLSLFTISLGMYLYYKEERRLGYL